MKIVVDIRRSREERGLTQEELARAVGCSPSAISEIERGRNYPRIELLAKIAQVLNKPISQLVQVEFDRGVGRCE